MTAFESNKGLFNYRQVKPIDALYARIQIELLVSLAVFSIFILIGTVLGYQTRIYNVILFLLVTVEFIIFCFCLGLFCAVIGHFSNTFQKIVKILMRPIFFSSGIFFCAAAVPEKYRKILLINPVLNFLEFFRFYFFEFYPQTDASHVYLLFLTAILALLSYFFYINLEIRVRTTS
jgi:capsular polysaccharide transport system permease protein